MRKIEKHLIILTLAILFTLTISGAVSAQTYNTNLNFISITPSSTGADNDVTLYARLTRQGTSSGIDSQIINFYDQNGNLLATDTTDNQGRAYATYHVPAGISPGTITVHAYYAGRSDPPGQDDGYRSSTSGTLALTITATNHAPVANDDSKTIAEDHTATGQISASDADGDTLTYTKTTDPVHGTVTINPNTGAYTYTPNPNWSGTDSFTVTVSDGKGGSDTATVTISVTPVNDVPTVGNYDVTTPEDTDATGKVIGSDIDSTLTYSLGTLASQGTVIVNPDGSWTYTPKPNRSGIDSFTVTISDGLNTVISTVTIHVTPVNDLPMAVDDTASTNEDTSLTTGNVAGNDIPSGDGGNVWSVVSGPAHGTLVMNADGTYTYTPYANYNGHDMFYYQIRDADGDISTAKVDITINSVNDLPVAVDDTATTNEETQLTGNVAGNDIPSGDGSNIWSLVSGPAHGYFVIHDNGDYVYIPDTDYNGLDYFTYRITDANGDVSIATMTISVTPVNDVPTVGNYDVTTSEDTSTGGTVVGSDVDSTLIYSVTKNPSYGTITSFNPNTGAWTYMPSGDYNGDDSFEVTVNDGTLSDISTVKIHVTPVNDLPVANDASQTIDEDHTATGTVIATDVDGDSLAYAKDSDPAHGSVTVNADGSYTYTPEANYHGTDSFKVLVSDGHGGSDIATVTITVNPVNDAPVANDGSQTIDEDHTATGQVTAIDVDGDSLTYTLGTGPSHGTVTVDPATGAYTYTPEANYHGTDSFTVLVSDGHEGFATATVTITVNSVNDAPVATGDSKTTPEDTSVSSSVSGSDIDGDSLAYAKNTDPAHGTVVVNSDGTYTYTPNGNWFGTDSFTVLVSDGHGGFATATVTITVNSVNDVPVANDGSQTIDEDTSATGTVTGSDVDGDSLAYAKDSDPAHGTVTVNADGSYTYTPEANYHGTDSFTVLVSDGHGGLATVTVTITVTPVNDADVFVKTSISKIKLFIGENTVVTVKVGNNGPDSAQNVVVTYKIPEGMTFVGLTYEAGYPAPVYDPATNTVTWNLGDLGIIDPWMKVVLYADETGTITNSANVISDTSDLVESNNLASIIVEIQNLVPEQPSIPEANAVSKTRTIPLQHTGLPLAGFVLAALAIAGGLIPKRKN